MAAAQKVGFATAKDLLLLPDDVRAEVIEGQIVYKVTSGEHGNAQASIIRLLAPFHRRGGGHQPGGWWILSEVEVELLAHEVYRPDVAGWRRERVSECPRGRPQTVMPDWVCEVLSPSNASNDLVKKLRVYHRCDIKHYWIVDPIHETLTVFRYGPDGCIAVLTADKKDRVRAEPFDAIEFGVGMLFGYEEEEVA